MRARGADRSAIRRELTRRTASTDTLHDENYRKAEVAWRPASPSSFRIKWERLTELSLTPIKSLESRSP
jgi:hypothetical protein